MTLGRLRLSEPDARDLAEDALRGIGYHSRGPRGRPGGIRCTPRPLRAIRIARESDKYFVA